MEKEISIDGLRIKYEESGRPDGEPVILMHGWGCNHTTVRSVAATLQDSMRIINIDLPGHGDSMEPAEVWGTFDFATAMKKFIENLGITNPALIGHSFGGRTAIALSTILPVKKIVLIDAAGIKPKRSLNYYFKVYSYKFSKKMALIFLGKERAGKRIEQMLQKRGSADYKSSSPMMRAIMSRCVNEDLKNIMHKIQSPVLLIWGENDTATPMRDARIMEKLIPDAGLVAFPGCGHYSFLDNPLGFKTVMREFFKPEITDYKKQKK